MPIEDMMNSEKYADIFTKKVTSQMQEHFQKVREFFSRIEHLAILVAKSGTLLL